MRRALYVLAQCVWGLPQTLVGLIVFVIFRLRRCPCRVFHGAVCTEWDRTDGVSLGLFIFCPPHGRLHPHEFGHTVQSLWLGPLYLPLVALPSLVWCGLPAFKRYRRVKNVPYSRLWCEGWADREGERMKRRAARRNS